jgi:hypothetical protein
VFFHFLRGQAHVDEKVADFRDLLPVFLLGDVNWPPAGREDADHVPIAGRLHAHPPGEQIARVKTTRRVQANPTLFINVLHIEPDLIDVAREQKSLGIFPFGFSGCDEAAQRISGHRIKERLGFFYEQFANALLAARNAGGFGQPF